MDVAQSEQFDVIIAGGAMVGATLALALSQRSRGQLSIAVVELFQSDHQAHPGFDSRSIALSYGTVKILESYQLWGGLKHFAEPIEHIHVSDRGHAGMTDITPQQAGVDTLGYVVELERVGLAYKKLLEDRVNIHLICPNSVNTIERDADKAHVTLNDGRVLQSKIVVAADGALSTCCQQIGLELSEHDFGQTAVIANITSNQSHQGKAYERFTETGPVALLPMTENRLSLVWCLPPEEAQQTLSLSDDEFLSKLQSAFGWRVGRLDKVGSRASYPLLLRHRPQTTSHRFVALGNAAQTLHPIAGQGFNLGIRDVASLVDEMLNSLDDVGAYSVIAAYKARREQDRSRTMMMTKGLVHTFSNEWLSLRVGRNLSLMAMDNIGLLKAPLLKQTLGLVAR
ncbi:2-octaprenyl-6-methoxyphenyl hydroxylase [Vibrio maerlii]|uniref:2-octaprenyl-6-methoxyphenyl hydroxylase n=1 Tax=Vibrio maerlii TaxID=2231648 RepID=UPI000E3D51E8|nr:2-octaprenyl-6-methoxyphenyl hydroxylase [Vibrio maerlii]